MLTSPLMTSRSALFPSIAPRRQRVGRIIPFLSFFFLIIFATESTEDANDDWEDLEAAEAKGGADDEEKRRQKKIALKESFDAAYDDKGEEKVEDKEGAAKEGEEETSYFDKMKREIDEQRARTAQLFGLQFAFNSPPPSSSLSIDSLSFGPCLQEEREGRSILATTWARTSAS